LTEQDNQLFDVSAQQKNYWNARYLIDLCV